MEEYIGKKIFNGIAIGKILFYSKNQQQVKRRKIEDTEAENKRFEEAKTFKPSIVQIDDNNNIC